MINHTLLLAFDEPISDTELDQVLTDIDAATAGTGVVTTFAARRHLAVPGEEAIPAFIATAVLQFGLADLDALGVLFTAPAVEEAFDQLRTRHPFKAAWVNHDPLS
jgi:hypothetical protein